jgi:hypothetical protein
VTTLVWRGLDEPRMEIVRFESAERAEGTQIGLTYELRWRLDGPRLDLEVVGERGATVELGDCDFFDLGYSPYFNSLPVWRDGFGEPREYTMRFVDVPSLDAQEARQRYEPVGERVIRYSSGSFQADIEFDADGFVTLYHDFLERIA